ncbi:MAG TPA: hypothetical protein VJ225_00075 [Nitrososphaeraceae archaeon]|nr:hypothetical protein [Nitrososphaeraceae archaeon]
MSLRGYDKAYQSAKDVEKYIQGDISNLLKWISKIENTAKELCIDPDCKRIQFKIDVNGVALIDTNDNDALDCLFRSFETHKNSMPYMSQTIVNQLLTNYRERRKESQST